MSRETGTYGSRDGGKTRANRAQERSKRGDFLAHRRSHPDADDHGVGAVIPEELAGPGFTNPQRPGGEDADTTFRDSVELRQFRQ